jgi:hypothetical protein
MPAFTFEKISPPPAHDSIAAPVSPIEKKPRGAIVQFLGRFVEARVQRVLRADKNIIDRREQRETE